MSFCSKRDLRPFVQFSCPLHLPQFGFFLLQTPAKDLLCLHFLPNRERFKAAQWSRTVASQWTSSVVVCSPNVCICPKVFFFTEDESEDDIYLRGPQLTPSFAGVGIVAVQNNKIYEDSYVSTPNNISRILMWRDRVIYFCSSF